MAKLIFRYGAMGSSKTANALMVRYNYLEKGYYAYLLKPSTDTRDGQDIIRSRIGLRGSCELVSSFLKRLPELRFDPHSVIIIDEAQFMSPEEVEAFARIVDAEDITVIAYGLMTDFRSELFPGSKRLCELADRLEEIPTLCWCGKKAHFNTRFNNGVVVRSGAQVMLGGNESYVPLCRKHFFEGKLHGDTILRDLTAKINGVETIREKEDMDG